MRVHVRLRSASTRNRMWKGSVKRHQETVDLFQPLGVDFCLQVPLPNGDTSTRVIKGDKARPSAS